MRVGEGSATWREPLTFPRRSRARLPRWWAPTVPHRIAPLERRRAESGAKGLLVRVDGLQHVKTALVDEVLDKCGALRARKRVIPNDLRKRRRLQTWLMARGAQSSLQHRRFLRQHPMEHDGAGRGFECGGNCAFSDDGAGRRS